MNNIINLMFLVTFYSTLVRTKPSAKPTLAAELSTISEDQLKDFVITVCDYLFLINVTAEECQRNFLSIDVSISGTPSQLKQRCQTTKTVTFVVDPPQDTMQIVVLVPKDDTVEYVQFEFFKKDEVVDIPIEANVSYRSWMALLYEDGRRSKFVRRSDVVPHEYLATDGDRYRINVSMSYWSGDTLHADGTFTWNSNDETDACFVITNSCNKQEMGNLYEKKIRPLDGRNVTLKELSVDDECVFTVRGKYGESSLIYRVPSNDSVKVTNISLHADVSESGTSWDIYVTWSPPKRQPSKYHVTLRLNTGEIRNVTLPGHETGCVFKDVKAQGLYNVTVGAVDRGWEYVNTVKSIFFPGNGPAEDTNGVARWAACATGIILAAVGLTLALYCRTRARSSNNIPPPDYLNPGKKGVRLPVKEGVEGTLWEDEWEVRLDQLQFHEVIGEGAFGVVRRATLAPAGKEVAVKMLKEFPSVEEIRSFHAEIELMKSVGGHAHLVSLVGCCTGPGRKPLIIVEFCSRGDLLSYLRFSWDVMISKRNTKYYNNNNNIGSSDYRNDLFKTKYKPSNLVINKLYDLDGICNTELTSVDLLSFCRQIAMGMEFLALNRVVHRDLAARNVLVCSDKTLKIADFGLSRDIYQNNQYTQKGNGKMPVKWMALESLTHRIYTTQSDVWSFGVVIWEVVTVGGSPYPGVAAARLPRLLKAGYRMPRPYNCGHRLYELMLSCWAARPRDRPTFNELHTELDALLNSAAAHHYLTLTRDLVDQQYEPSALLRGCKCRDVFNRAKKFWSRGENYERPSNHYTKPPQMSRQPLE